MSTKTAVIILVVTWMAVLLALLSSSMKTYDQCFQTFEDGSSTPCAGH